MDQNEAPKKLSIIIIGSSANLESAGQTPNDLEALEENMTLYLIDPEFANVLQLNTTNEHILEERKRILHLDYDKIILKHSFNVNLRDLFTEEVLVVSYIGVESYHFLTYLTGLYHEDGIYFYIPENQNKRHSISKLLDRNLWVKPFNIYSGEVFTGRDEEKKEVYKLYIVMLDFILNYFDAGINDSNTTYPTLLLPGWCYQTEIPVLKGLITYYGLDVEKYKPNWEIPHSGNGLHRAAFEIFESAHYRNLILTIMCQIISNFAVNNQLISNEKLEKIKNAEFWEDIEIYETILSKLKKLTK